MQDRTCGRDSRWKRVADEGTQALIAAEEEEFVLLDWPAHRRRRTASTTLALSANDGNAGLCTQVPPTSQVEEVAGVPVAVAVKRVSRAVKRVGPRSDSHVHDGAGPPAVLRFRIFLEVEFLDGVDGQDRRPIGERTRHTGDGAIVIEIDIDDAVHHPDGFIGPAVVGALGPWASRPAESSRRGAETTDSGSCGHSRAYR